MAAALFTADSLSISRRRLERLQQQAAALGYDAPPHIVNEIQDLQREIAAAAPATVAESHDILYTLVHEVRADVRRLYYLMPICMLLLCGLLILLVKL